MPTAQEALDWLKASGTGEDKIAYLENVMRDFKDDPVQNAIKHLDEVSKEEKADKYPGTRRKLELILQGVDPMSDAVQGKPPRDAEAAKMKKLAESLVATQQEMEARKYEGLASGVGDPAKMAQGRPDQSKSRGKDKE